MEAAGLGLVLLSSDQDLVNKEPYSLQSEESEIIRRAKSFAQAELYLEVEGYLDSNYMVQHARRETNLLTQASRDQQPKASAAQPRPQQQRTGSRPLTSFIPSATPVKHTISEDCTQGPDSPRPTKLHCLQKEAERWEKPHLDYLKKPISSHPQRFLGTETRPNTV
ncbi:hypothetical protein BDV06DRAFT_150514 [Aspergillus oleicola]